ncbi:ribonuclease III [Candidatus Synchoanobacter obligatus]|uniref:Ribonuclease 3 n=1 Tax=Candidatus Synchoanobacter obligatus TaxID=2919597 RepID=A0ABT1L5A0_9GAMM|nr:ribonuclease III [Candidatus Synchoanobacter obligatus]MCP8352131.1 ribonuclease III [Candidatus Synchoanobacter obligatus]
MTAWAKLQQKINYVFKDRSLLQQAITHKSACKSHYEKMEFLGDSALNFYIGYLLYTEHPDMSEGNLSIARSKLVNKNILAAIGEEIDIDAFIRVDKNQAISQSIRADVIEAIIGAAFLDGGVSASELIILKLFFPRLKTINCLILKDPKSRLQEHAHKKSLKPPVYQIIKRSGEEHCTTYLIECQLCTHTTQGIDNSKRRAEMAAATAMLQQLNQELCHE